MDAKKPKRDNRFGLNIAFNLLFRHFGFYFVKRFFNIRVGLLCQKAYDDYEYACDDKRGEKLVNIKRGTRKLNSYDKLPNKYHGSAGDHARERTPFCSAFPEQTE